MLAEFAFYSGVGYKTTMGFGQTFTHRFAAKRSI
jgi:CRISPR/Cas system endoribonuclease Cas6 (RAMP superfamily)